MSKVVTSLLERNVAKKYVQTELVASNESVIADIISNCDFWLKIFTAEGPCASVVLDHPATQNVKWVIKKFGEMMEKREIPYKMAIFITDRNIKKGAKLDVWCSVFVCVNKWSNKTFLKHIEGIKEDCRMVRDNLSDAEQAFKLLSNMQSGDNLSLCVADLDEHRQNVCSINSKLKESNVSLRCLTEEQVHLGRWKELYSKCSILKEVMTIPQFLNFLKDEITCTLDLVDDEEGEENEDICISFLFDERSENSGVNVLQCSTKSILFFICNTCIPKFQNMVENLLFSEGNVALIDVIQFFGKQNISDNDLRKFEVWTRKNIPLPSRKAMKYITNFNEIHRTAIDLERFCGVFDIKINEDNSEMSNCVEQILQMKIKSKSLTLSELHERVSKVETTLKVVQQEGGIIHELSKAKALVHFLTDIADDDLRNLIDAVEEHSEQYVQESTISDLIQVKRFLYPLLHNTSTNVRQLIGHLMQCKTEKRKDVEVQINTCLNNLHSLKVLYNSVANRGEVTKEVVNNILENGIVKYVIPCEKNEVVVQCTKKKKVDRYGLPEMRDLRSRCLLISNTEKTEKNESSVSMMRNMQCFITMTNSIISIWELASNLRKYGHYSYQKFSWKTTKQNVQGRIKELESEEELLQKRLHEWESTLGIVRRGEYYLNFIHSEQITILQDFFERPSFQTQQVQPILQYMSSCLRACQETQSCFNVDYSTSENLLQKKLENLGGALKNVMKNSHSEHTSFPTDEEFKLQARNIDAHVKPGLLYMAHIDTKSKHFVPILLSLYANTSGKFPKPHEILVCDEQTKWEELELIINRCLLYEGPDSNYNLHTIAGIENLEYDIQNHLVSLLHQVNRMDSKKFLLAVLCRESTLHPIIIEFSRYVHRIPGLSDEALSKCFKEACPFVYTITSDVPGLGKTESIKEKACREGNVVRSIQVSGPVNKQHLTQLFLNCRGSTHEVLHIDIGVVDNPVALDSFLFELIVLQCAISGTMIVHLPVCPVAIEIANTLRQQLRDDLYMISCFDRVHLKWRNFSNFIVSQNVKSPVQIVCQYLNAVEEGTIGFTDIVFAGKNKVGPLSRSVCHNLLQNCLSSSSDISFTIATVFLNVLAQQLFKLSNSQYFRVGNLKVMLKTKEMVYSVRTTMVEALVEIAKEFACRSIHTCKSAQHIAICEKSGILKETEAMLKRVDGMIRWADSNHLLVVFHSQNIQTVTPLYRKLVDVPKHIQELFQTQIGRQLVDFENVKRSEIQDMLEKIVCTATTSQSAAFKDFSKTYALTPDNLLKMVLIIMRLRSGIPVVLMGETGCGKTSLVRYLALTCGIEFKIFPLHAGVSRPDIISTVTALNEEARSNRQKEIWLFLDEINTCNHLGLLNDVLCHRIVNNCRLSPNLKCLAACNPYRLRDKSQILTTGLGGKTVLDQFSQLIYRVHPLPESMIDYVWDYGTLSDADEKKYINSMVQHVIKELPSNSVNVKIVDVLVECQSYIRSEEKNDWSVSLRDIYRCCHLIPWFHRMLHEKAKYCRKSYNKPRSEDEFVYRAVILTLAHCYEVRLQQTSQRKIFWQIIGHILYNKGNYDKFIMEDIIRHEQMDILERMEIEEGIAKNTALRENVFVIFVCIMNKIPVFLVGKPGCSKSLSMQLLKSNLRGLDSEDEYFQTLPQIYVVSYQGSESSTSEGIIKVFEKAERYRNQQKVHENILPVVLLDEIGLAEVSKFNPLKVLHSLLEPQTGQFPDVAVVGISNWSLDPAKMNRAIHLSRPDLNEEELYDTGCSISTITPKENQIIDDDTEGLQMVLDENILKALSEAYFVYHKDQTVANFHGLRDYYALIKYITREVQKSTGFENPDVHQVIQNGLLRNFGGMPSEMNRIVDIFFKNLQVSKFPQIRVDKLIFDNVADHRARHLLLITNGDSVIGEIGGILKKLNRDYRIFYGSSFDEDQKEEYSYRILSNIIYCMDHGLVLILKDLDEIYGSLYDMLNQNYTIVGKKKNCRIALGAHSNPMCHVHENFRCIVLVEEQQINYSDPPFLNRFEKQRLKFEDLLDVEEKDIDMCVKEWTEDFVTVETDNSNLFTVSDAFLGFHEETIPSLVKAIMSSHITASKEEIVEACKKKLLFSCTPDAILRLTCSKLLQSDDNAVKDISGSYFDLPINDGLKGAVSFILEENETEYGLKFVCFTRSNIHTDVKSVLGNRQNIQVENLGTFKSERQMTAKVELFFADSDTDLLILQSSISNDSDHLLLAKLQVENKRNQYLAMVADKPQKKKHVCFLLHIDTRDTDSCVQWQFDYSNEWELYTVDILDYGEMVPEMHDLNKGVLKNLRNQTECCLLKSNFCDIELCIKHNMLWAFSCLRYTSGDRHPNRMKYLIEEILSRDDIISCLSDIILNRIGSGEDESDRDHKHWQVTVACNKQMLSEGNSMIEAWRKHLESLVKSPLAKLVWIAEDLGAWDSIISAQKGSWINSIWMRQLENLDLNCSIDPQGMMSMNIEYPPLALTFPFSRIFMKKVKAVYNLMCEDKLSIGTDNIAEVPEDKFIELVNRYTSLIENGFTDALGFYENVENSDEWWPMIIEDFCNEFSWYPDVSIDEGIRIKACQKFLCSRSRRLGKIAYISQIAAFVLILAVENARIWAMMRLLSICDKDTVKAILDALDDDLERKNLDFDSEETVEQESETGEASFIEDTIANKVTESIVPFDGRLQYYGGIKNWIEHATAIMYYNNKVGGECDTTNFIRLCFDLVTYVIEPYNLDESILVQFTKHACAETGFVSLDSEGAYQYLMEISSQIKGNEDVNYQKLLALYFARCFETNPETPHLKPILEHVTGKFSKSCITYIGPFLQCLLFDLEDVMENITEAITSDDFGNSLPLQELHSCMTNKSDDALFIMCVDSVVHMLERDTDIGNLGIPGLESRFDDFNMSLQAIQAGAVAGLQKVVCIAYCNVYLQSVAACCSSFNTSQDYNILQKIDSSLLIDEKCEESDFYLALVCRISRGSVKDLQKKCEMLQDALPGLNTLPWPEDDIANGVGFDIFSLTENYDETSHALQQFIDKNENELQDIMSKIKYHEFIRKGLIGAIAMKFYWPKCVQGHRKDTSKDFGIWIEKNTAHLDCELRRLLLCLSGHNDFNSEVLNVSTQHSYENILQANVLVHLAGSIISFANYSKENHDLVPENLFTRCIFQPDQSQSSLMPQSVYDGTSFVYMWCKCRCSHNLISGQMLKSCPACKSKEVHFQQKENVANNDKYEEITLKKFLEAPAKKTSIQNSIIKLLIQGSLIVGYSLGIDKISWINDLTYKELVQNFQCTWIEVQNSLFDHPLKFALLLHKIIHHQSAVFHEEINCEDTKSVQAYAHLLVKAIQCELSGGVTNLVEFGKDILEKSRMSGGLVELTHRVEMTVEMRQAKKPTLEHMLTMMSIQTEIQDTKFQFLKLLIKWEPKLNMLTHLFPILQWQLDIHHSVNHKLTRNQATSMDLHKFIFDNESGDQQDWQKKFDAFMDALTSITQPEYNEMYSTNIPSVTYKTSLHECVIENEQHFIVEILSSLIEIQNKFLEECSQLALVNNKAMKFLCQKEVVCIPYKSVQQLKYVDVIYFKWPKQLLRFAQNETDIDSGEGVIYDFFEMEKELAYTLLLGKPFVDVPSHIFKTIYRNEMFHWCSHIFRDINNHIPQEQITSDMQNSIIQGANENPESLRSALDYLEIVITKLYKTGGNTTDTIYAFAERWDIDAYAIKSKTIQSQMKNYMRLCHIVSVYEFLEDRLSYIAINTISKDYCKTIPDTAQKCLLSFLEKNLVPAESCQTALKRLISRYMCSSNESSPTTISAQSPMKVLICQAPLWPAGVTKDGIIADQKGMDGIPLKIDDVFPDVLLMEHVSATHRIVTEYIEKIKSQVKLPIVEKKATTNRNRKGRRQFFQT